MDVGGAGNIGSLIRTAGLDPYLDGHDGRKMVFLNGDAQAVFEGEKQAIWMLLRVGCGVRRDVRHGLPVFHTPTGESRNT